MCSGSDWAGSGMSDKHIATRLTRYAPVLFVEPPRSIVRLLRDPKLRAEWREHRLQSVGPRIARLTPLAPPGVSRPGLRTVARWTTRLAMRRAVRALGGDVHAVIISSFDNLFGACGEQLRVLYGMDDLAAGGELMDLSPQWLLGQERAQLRRADRIIAVSDALGERWSAMGYSVTTIPNGCDADRYAQVHEAVLPDDVTLPAPVAGVIGLLSERIELDYLEAVADTGLSLLLVGSHHPTFEPERFAALVARANVQWVGSKPFEQISSYLRVLDVGLTPYADSAFNRASFPIKTLEYLSAGLPVISSDIPASRWLDTDMITIEADPAAFAKATVAAANRPGREDDAEGAERQAFARRHSWEERVRQFLPVLDRPDRPLAD
jgi:teichuronic acid biosynthesis glycosyltransferase TuaH